MPIIVSHLDSPVRDDEIDIEDMDQRITELEMIAQNLLLKVDLLNARLASLIGMASNITQTD